MKTEVKIKSKKFIAVATILIFALGQSGIASAATKTISCYKGTSVKKVTTKKCPAGWSSKKPAAAKPATPTSSKSVAIDGTYKGTVALLWGDTYVQVTSVKATGTGTVADLAELVGSGAAAPASQCDTFDGTAVLGTGANTIKVAFDSSAKGCAEDDSAPTTVKFGGNAVIKSGTGKYQGATGTFKVAGSFSIKTITAGSKESVPFTMTASGSITLK